MSRCFRRVRFASVVFFLLSLLIVGSPPQHAAAADFGAAYSYAFGAYPNGIVVNSVNLGTGSLTLSATDLAMSGRLLGFAFTRWYNSADAASGPLGPGWTHSYNWSIADFTSYVNLRRGDGSVDQYTANGGGSYLNPPGAFATLLKNGNSTYTLTQTNQTQYEFDTSGRLTRIHEPAGNQIVLAYTGALLAQITDSVGRVVTLSYDGSNRLTQLLDPIGRKVTYAYDGSGRLGTVTDKLGNAAGQNPLLHQWKYAYDGTTSHLTTVTDPDGRVLMTNSYDAQGRVATQKDGLNNQTTFDWSVAATAKVTDPKGHLVTYTVDSRQRLASRSDTAGGITSTTTYTYDALGDLASVTDATGAKTTYAYDTRGNLTSKTDPAPLNYVTSYVPDAKNNLKQRTDARGYQTNFVYDPATNVLTSLSRQIDATTSATTSYQYLDPANPGLPTRVTSPRGFVTTLGYDAQGNLTSRIDPDGNKTTYSPDGVGRRTSAVDPDGYAPGGVAADHTWQTAYDENDRVTKLTDPLGHLSQSGYDGAGHLQTFTDKNGNITAYAYFPTGALQTVSQKPDPVAQPTLVYLTQVGRDPNGNATTIIQANGVVTDYGYDEHNLLTSMTTHPSPTSSLTTSYARNGNGDPTKQTTPDGIVTTWGYDVDGRLTSESTVWSGVCWCFTFTYDATGNRISDGTLNYRYDGLGRLLSATKPPVRGDMSPTAGTGASPGALSFDDQGGTIAYGYDLDSDVTSMAITAGDTVYASLVNSSLAWSYTPADRLSQVTDWLGRATTYAYSPAGRVKTISFPSGIGASYQYDTVQRVKDIAYSFGATQITHHVYGRDNEGNVTALDEFLAGITPTGTLDHFAMSYDGLNRLTSVSGSAETFGLDEASNLATRSAPTASYSYDLSNRLTSDGTSSYTWSPRDLLLQKGTQTYTYDPRGLMTQPGGLSYDAGGQMTTISAATSQWNFIWDIGKTPPAVLEIWNSNGAPSGNTRFANGLGPLYFEGTLGAFSVLAQDALGSVRAEIHSDGTARTFRYKAYGDIAAASPTGATPSLLGFAGRPFFAWLQPGGLLFMPARWYDPTVGRFLSRDPSHGLPEAPLTLNGFNYANGNPLARLDPTGFAATADAPGACDAACQKEAQNPSGPFPDLSIGGLFGTSVEGGLGPLASAADTFSIGRSAGKPPIVFESGGSFETVSGKTQGTPSQTDAQALGGYIGLGFGGFVTNAKQPSDYAGRFHIAKVDIGTSVVGFSLERAYSDEGIFVLAAEFGLGVGAAFVTMDTTAKATYAR